MYLFQYFSIFHSIGCFHLSVRDHNEDPAPAHFDHSGGTLRRQDQFAGVHKILVHKSGERIFGMINSDK